MTGLPAPLLISVLCMRMGFSDVGGGFVAAASSNIEIGGKGSPSATALFVLEHGRGISLKGCRAVFGSASCWKKGFRLRGASVVRQNGLMSMPSKYSTKRPIRCPAGSDAF